jgi:hypothetical protein
LSLNTFRRHNGCSVRLLLTSFLLTSCSGFNVSYLVDIVLAVKLHFRSGCVCIAHDQVNGKSGKSVIPLGNRHLILGFNLFRIWYYILGKFSKRNNFSHSRKLESQTFLTRVNLGSSLFLLLGDISASVFYVPSFRNTLFHLNRSCGQEHEP